MTKIATSIEQSKKLAEILPAESADMSYRPYREEGGIPDYHLDLCPHVFASWIGVPAWSLAALLDVLPYTIKDHNDRNFYFKLESVENDAGHRGYNIQYYQDIECYLMTMYDYDNPVDACYEMVIKLHEEGLL